MFFLIQEAYWTVGRNISLIFFDIVEGKNNLWLAGCEDIIDVSFLKHDFTVYREKTISKIGLDLNISFIDLEESINTLKQFEMQ